MNLVIEVMRREQLAGHVAATYRPRAGLRGAMLSGSVARGWADRWSDIEIGLFWDVLPGTDSLGDMATALDVTERDVYTDEEQYGIVNEEFVCQGIKVDLVHMTVNAMSQTLEAATLHGRAELETQARVAAVRDAIPLAGRDLIAEWQAASAIYPAHLRRDLIERNLIFGPHKWLDMLVARRDVLVLYDILCRIERALVSILLALNSTYAASDSFKWIGRTVDQLAIAPVDVSDRLELLLCSEPAVGVTVAMALIDETLELVGTHVPEIDLAPVLSRIHSARH
jgi:hypothetical protein